MKLYPSSWFPSLACDNSECEPTHSIVCRYVGIDPLDSESVVTLVDVHEAFMAVYGEECEDFATAGDFYYVSNSMNGYGYLVSAGQGEVGSSTPESRLLNLQTC